MSLQAQRQAPCRLMVDGNPSTGGCAMTRPIHQIPAVRRSRRPALVEPPADHIEAMAWLRAQLQWEGRLSEVRHAHHDTAPIAGDLVPNGRPRPRISRRARTRRGLAAVLLGVSVTAGLLVIAPPSGGGSPSISGPTPVVGPVSGPPSKPAQQGPNSSERLASAGASGVLAGPQALEFGR
jgi:hypothetical protein